MLPCLRGGGFPTEWPICASKSNLVRQPKGWREFRSQNICLLSAKCTIVFISLSAAQSKLEADWALTSGIVRRCPLCSRDSVVGHGWRQKQSHDEHHDWITIRRGICRPCGKTITFLPVFSLPYTHYSLIARSAALRRRFVEGCSGEAAAARERSRSQTGFTFPQSLVPSAGFLPAAIFVLATYDGGPRWLDAERSAFLPP